MTTNNKGVSSGSLVTPVKPFFLKLRLVTSKKVEIHTVILLDTVLSFTCILDCNFWNYCTLASQVAEDMPADAGFVCDRAAVVGDVIKRTVSALSTGILCWRWVQCFDKYFCYLKLCLLISADRHAG